MLVCQIDVAVDWFVMSCCMVVDVSDECVVIVPGLFRGNIWHKVYFINIVDNMEHSFGML